MDMPQSSRINPDIVCGMVMNEGGELQTDIQKAILLGGGFIPPEISDAKLCAVVDSALRTISFRAASSLLKLLVLSQQ